MHRAELSGEIVKMVGWLEADEPFLQGAVPAEDVAKLGQLVIHTWKPPFMAGGWHDCTLCPRKPGDGPIMWDIGGQQTMLGATEIYVPAGEVMFSAPNLILHYIADHGYRPPEVFLAAVRKCDPHLADYHAACDAIFQGG
ncbi:MAG: hypothetical protein JRI68_11915 [Deltaproteobacteria bacterium]|nr:hypothetical protein [Deltaproteobacteria bacterium]